MQLNEAETDRSYLFGRLLAVLEKAERDTYDREEKREPSAIRLQSVFTNRPLDTFKVIHDALNPYFAQLPPPSRAYYKKLIGDIVCAIDDPESANLPLESNYLFGYYLQRKALYTKNKNNDSEE